MATTSAKVTFLGADGTIQVIEVDADIFGFGTAAQRPVAGSGVGDMYLLADPPTFELQYWNGAWQTLGGAGGGISGPGASVDRGVVVWDGLTGTAIDDAGIRNYGLSATDPTVPAPADGDFYVNSVLDMAMLYDGTRAKWLSIETVEIPFNRNGNTGGGAFYRMGNRAMSSSLGRTAEWDGTVVSISYTRQDVDLATFEVIANGVTSLATLASSATSGTTLTADGDFSQGDILGVKNQTGSNTTRHVVGFARIKWRAT